MASAAHTITTHRIEWLLLLLFSSNITVCWNRWRADADGIQIGWRQEAKKENRFQTRFYDRRRRQKLNIDSWTTQIGYKKENEFAQKTRQWHFDGTMELSPKQNKSQTSSRAGSRTSAKKKTLINRSNKRRRHFMLIERHLEKTRSENPRSNRPTPDDCQRVYRISGARRIGVWLQRTIAHSRYGQRLELKLVRLASARSQMFANVT